MRKYNYLIGNAHLDPVWQWRWQEGASEARATFASALARMKEFPDFVFTCAGAGIYEWIEETAPAMFEEIRERVREGRWVIVGGMWIQPDCNLPSGESFVRQVLYSQRYFKEKFGVESKVGYNVDSFGHSANLPQILSKAGMHHYVFMRPMKHEKEMEENVFLWEAPDGSRVTCFRIPMAYCCNFDDADKMKEWFENSIAEQPDYASSMLFYGVGNHGGGPTKKNIEFAKSLDKENEKMIFASPIDYFRAVESEGKPMPVWKDDLQHHASGCYAAVSEVKRLNRRAENALAAAERAGFLAEVFTGMAPAKDEIREAWKNVMFAQFHDSLGGCSTTAVYPDIFAMQQESISRAERLENTAYQRLAENIDTTAVPLGKQAMVVFNPTTSPVKTLVRANKEADAVRNEKGELVPSQRVFSPTSVCTGRDDTLFLAEVPALGWRLYYTDDVPENADYGLRAGEDYLENHFIRVEFDKTGGCIRRMYSKTLGRQIYGVSSKPVVYDETKHDTWSHGMNFFDERVGECVGGKLELLEAGPIYAVVRATSTFGSSTVSQYFSLSAFADTLDLKVELDWHEKHKLLKLEYDTGMASPAAIYEIPYADITRPADGEEEPGLAWTAAADGEGTAVIWNDAKYSSSVRGSVICLTAIRSPLYGDHGRERKPMHTFTDQGESSFSYRIGYQTGEPDRAAFARIGEEVNLPLRVLYDYVHEGRLPSLYEGVRMDGNAVFSVVKKSEDGKSLIVRAVERAGRKSRSKLNLALAGRVLELEFEPYEIKTLALDENGVREVNLIEEA